MGRFDVGIEGESVWVVLFCFEMGMRMDMVGEGEVG